MIEQSKAAKGDVNYRATAGERNSDVDVVLAIIGALSPVSSIIAGPFARKRRK